MYEYERRLASGEKRGPLYLDAERMSLGQRFNFHIPAPVFSQHVSSHGADTLTFEVRPGEVILPSAVAWEAVLTLADIQERLLVIKLAILEQKIVGRMYDRVPRELRCSSS